MFAGSPNPEPMLRFKWLILGAFLACAAGIGLFIWFTVFHTNAVARMLSDALLEKLHARPAIYLHNYVVVEEKKPIAELALVSRMTDVEHRIESVRLNSKAELSLRAAFDVKAGFDFRTARYEVVLDPGLTWARLDLPSPKVLSVEMTHYEVIVDRSGWWNRISESEKELAMRDLQADAKLEAIRAGILNDCKQALEKDMSDISRNAKVKLEFRFLTPVEALQFRPGTKPVSMESGGGG